MKLSLVFLFLSLSSGVFCSDNNAIMTFCSKSTNNFEKLKSHINFLKISEDKILYNGLCIDLKTKSLREDLFYKYIKKSIPTTRITTSNLMENSQSCKLKIRKISQTKNNKRSFRNRKDQLSLKEKLSNEDLKEIIHISTLNNIPSKVRIKNSILEITCKRKRNNNYQLELVSQSPYLSIHNNFSLKAGIWKKVGNYSSEGFSKSKDIAIIKNQISNNSKSVKILIDLKVEP